MCNGGGSASTHSAHSVLTHKCERDNGIRVRKRFRTCHVVGVYVRVKHVFQRQAQLLHQLRVSVNSVKMQESLVVGAESY
jgi:hypothetical protein